MYLSKYQIEILSFFKHSHILHQILTIFFYFFKKIIDLDGRSYLRDGRKTFFTSFKKLCYCCKQKQKNVLLVKTKTKTKSWLLSPISPVFAKIFQISGKYSKFYLRMKPIIYCICKFLLLPIVISCLNKTMNIRGNTYQIYVLSYKIVYDGTYQIYVMFYKNFSDRLYCIYKHFMSINTQLYP